MEKRFRLLSVEAIISRRGITHTLLNEGESIVFDRTVCVSLIIQSIQKFIHNSDLNDLRILVGSKGRVVPAHRVVLGLCCNGLISSEQVIRLPFAEYPILRALL